jgi:hypothetical protein
MLGSVVQVHLSPPQIRFKVHQETSKTRMLQGIAGFLLPYGVSARLTEYLSFVGKCVGKW